MEQNINMNQPINSPDYYISSKRKVLDFIIGFFGNIFSIPLYIALVLVTVNLADKEVFSVDLHDLLGIKKNTFLIIDTLIFTAVTIFIEYIALKKLSINRYYIFYGMLIPLTILGIIAIMMIRLSFKGFDIF